MEEQLTKFASGTPNMRIAAVDPAALEGHPKRDALMPLGCCADGDATMGTCNNAGKGRDFLLRSCSCDFSHRIGYALIADEPDDQGFYLLLEDDVQFEGGPDWAKNIESTIKEAPPDWDMLRLGTWGSKDSAFAVDGHPRWHRSSRRGANGENWSAGWQGYFGAHAIVLTPPKARSLVSRCAKRHGDFADFFTADRDEFHSYALSESIICVADPEFELGSSRLDGTPNSKASNSAMLSLNNNNNNKPPKLPRRGTSKTIS